MIGFWDFKLTGAPPLLSFIVRRSAGEPSMLRSTFNHLKDITLVIAIAALVLFVFWPRFHADHQWLAVAKTEVEKSAAIYSIARTGIGLTCSVGSVIILLTLFQRSWIIPDNIWLDSEQRAVLVIISLLPIGMGLSAICFGHALEARTLTNCWFYPIPLWLLAAPAIFQGIGVITFVENKAKLVGWQLRRIRERSKRLAAAKTINGCVHQLCDFELDPDFVRYPRNPLTLDDRAKITEVAARTAITKYPATRESIEANSQRALDVLLKCWGSNPENWSTPLGAFLRLSVSQSAVIRSQILAESSELARRIESLHDFDREPIDFEDWQRIENWRSSPDRLRKVEKLSRTKTFIDTCLESTAKEPMA